MINIVLDYDIWYWNFLKSNEILKNWLLFVFVVKYLFEVLVIEVLIIVVIDISI